MYIHTRLGRVSRTSVISLLDDGCLFEVVFSSPHGCAVWWFCHLLFSMEASSFAGILPLTRAKVRFSWFFSTSSIELNLHSLGGWCLILLLDSIHSQLDIFFLQNPCMYHMLHTSFWDHFLVMYFGCFSNFPTLYPSAATIHYSNNILHLSLADAVTFTLPPSQPDIKMRLVPVAKKHGIMSIPYSSMGRSVNQRSRLRSH